MRRRRGGLVNAGVGDVPRAETELATTKFWVSINLGKQRPRVPTKSLIDRFLRDANDVQAELVCVG